MIQRPDWMLKAVCRVPDLSMLADEPFFHPEQERGPKREERIERAKAECRPCPVAAECLAHALRTEAPSTRWGVWGGKTPEERDEIAERVGVLS